MAAKNWELMADIARHLAEGCADQARWCVHWAYALREMDKVAEAKEVALRGLELHPDEAILHFYLACYLSLLGKFPEARDHLDRSIRLDERFKAEPVEDEDFAGLWDWFGKER
jgi:tetratricopeptide (TPR) repeat protein